MNTQQLAGKIRTIYDSINELYANGLIDAARKTKLEALFAVNSLFLQFLNKICEYLDEDNINQILQLSDDALAFFPDEYSTSLDNYQDKIRLFTANAINFADIQAIETDNHPLLNDTCIADILNEETETTLESILEAQAAQRLAARQASACIDLENAIQDEIDRLNKVCDLRFMASIPTLKNLPKGTHSAFVFVQADPTARPTALYFVDRSGKEPTIKQITKGFDDFLSAAPKNPDGTYKNIIPLSTEVQNGKTESDLTSVLKITGVSFTSDEADTRKAEAMQVDLNNRKNTDYETILMRYQAYTTQYKPRDADAIDTQRGSWGRRTEETTTRQRVNAKLASLEAFVTGAEHSTERSLGETLCFQLISEGEFRQKGLKGLTHLINTLGKEHRLEFVRLFKKEFKAEFALDNYKLNVERLDQLITVNTAQFTSQKWHHLLRTFFAPHKEGFENFFDCPLPQIRANAAEDEKFANKQTIGKVFARQVPMKNAFFVSKKSGGDNNPGPHGGNYLLAYLDENDEIQSQMLLYKQATDNDLPNNRENMAESMGATLGAAFGKEHIATVMVTLSPDANGQTGNPADAYCASVFSKDFEDILSAAHNYIDKAVPKRPLGKGCGQKINRPVNMLGGKNIGGAPDFQKGIVAMINGYTEHDHTHPPQHETDEEQGQRLAQKKLYLTSLAKAQMIALLMGDTQGHLENVGVATMANGTKQFVRIDHGPTGRRPFKPSMFGKRINGLFAWANTQESDQEFSNHIFPFTGLNKKQGVCYLRAFPLELLTSEAYTTETLRIADTDPEELKSALNDWIAKTVGFYGKDAFVNEFANEFRPRKKFNAKSETLDVAIEKFKTFYLDKMKLRQESIKSFAIELTLKRISALPKKHEREKQLRSLIDAHQDYFTSFEKTLKHYAHSKVLRTLALKPTFINEIISAKKGEIIPIPKIDWKIIQEQIIYYDDNKGSLRATESFGRNKYSDVMLGIVTCAKGKNTTDDIDSASQKQLIIACINAIKNEALKHPKKIKNIDDEEEEEEGYKPVELSQIICLNILNHLFPTAVETEKKSLVLSAEYLYAKTEYIEAVMNSYLSEDNYPTPPSSRSASPSGSVGSMQRRKNGDAEDLGLTRTKLRTRSTSSESF